MPYLGELSSLAAAALWSVSSMVFTAATRRIGSVNVNFSRLVMALCFLVATTVLLRLPVGVNASQLLYLSISGVIGILIGDTLLFTAFGEMGARLSMLVMSLAPAISAAGAFLVLGERLPGLAIGGMTITILGIAIVVMDKNREETGGRHRVTWKGLLFALGGATGQGVGLIFARLAFDIGAVHGIVAAMIRIAVATFLFLPFIMLRSRHRTFVRSFWKDGKALWYSAVGAVIGPYLGITCSLIAVANTEVGIAATLMATTPILMLPLVRLAYKERLSWQAIVGACIAVGGVGILFVK